MCRNTPTSTSVRFAADPHAAKQRMSRMNGTVSPGWTNRGLARAFWTRGCAPGCAIDPSAIRTTLPRPWTTGAKRAIHDAGTRIVAPNQPSADRGSVRFGTPASPSAKHGSEEAARRTYDDASRVSPRATFSRSRGASSSSREVEWVFVVVGEALVDLMGQRGGRTLAAHPGGSPANVALGLARLGNPVTLKTRVGRDAFGAMVRDHLEASGVVVDAGPGDDKVSTTIAIATLAAGIASYDFRIEWDVASLV